MEIAREYTEKWLHQQQIRDAVNKPALIPSESLELVNKLYQYKHPTRFILYEGADHGIAEFRDDRLAEMKKHFDYYLRDNKKLPNMEPHGK